MTGTTPRPARPGPTRGGAARVTGTDFRGAMRRNVRNTWLLCALVLAVACGFGYVIGWGLEVASGRHPALLYAKAPPLADLLLTRSPWGVHAAVAAAALAALWSLVALWAADDIMLALAGAREVDAAEAPVLHNVVEEMAIAAGMPKPRVFVMDTGGLNAFATGLRPAKAGVAVTAGLLARLNREELQAVLAHECGHILNGDIRYSVMLGAVVGLVAGVSEFILHVPGDLLRGASVTSESRNVPLPALLLVLVVWLLFALLAPVVMTLMRLAVSRQREYLADATAVKLTRNPVGLASALEKIAGAPEVERASSANEHLYIVSPLRLFDGDSSSLFSTHPPTTERVRRLMAMRR